MSSQPITNRTVVAPEVADSSYHESTEQLRQLVAHDHKLSAWLEPYAAMTLERHSLWHLAIVHASVAQLCHHSREQKRAWLKARLARQDAPAEHPWRWMRSLNSVQRWQLTAQARQACRDLATSMRTALHSKAAPQTDDSWRSWLCARADIGAIMWALQESPTHRMLLRPQLERLDAMACQSLQRLRHDRVVALCSQEERLLRQLQAEQIPWMRPLSDQEPNPQGHDTYEHKRANQKVGPRRGEEKQAHHRVK